MLSLTYSFVSTTFIMPPVARIRLEEPLERGQTTIFGTLNGRLSIQRPPPPPRPGPVPKASGQSNTVLGRRLIRGQLEKQVVELFAAVRLAQQEDGEPGDVDIANGRAILEETEDEDIEYIPTKRYAYSREQKLAAIDYFQTTWKELKDGTHERISLRSASKKLKVSRKQLRNWVANKERIQQQKRGTFRARKQSTYVQEPELERRLNAQFEAARDQGRKVSFK